MENRFSSSPDRPRALIVDEVEEIARLLAKTLAQVGYDATVAFDGTEAIRHLDRRTFDLLLIDLDMGGMGAAELQRRASLIDPDLAVVVVAGTEDADGVVARLRAGAFDCISKLAPPSRIAERLADALERCRSRRQVRENQRALIRRIEAGERRVRVLFLHAVKTLNRMMEARDPDTYVHSARVATVATAIADRLRPGDSGLHSTVRIAALFHDIGKIGVPEAVLNKPDRLTDDEMAAVRRHPEIGVDILSTFLTDPDTLAMIRHHHERVDGQGYPDGLAGEAIPLGARIIAVADAYDAMISDRPYRPGMAAEEAATILRDGAGTQWDPTVVEAFLRFDADSRPASGGAAIEAARPVAPSISPVRTAPPPYSRLRRPVVYTSGDLDGESLDRLRSKLGGLMGQGETDFVIDLRQVGCLTVDAMQFLYLLHLRVAESGGRVTLRDVPDHALNALRGADLEGTFTYETAPPRRPRRFTEAERGKRRAEAARAA